MYLFFDKSGVLREVINDEALRQYNQQVNTMFVYIEGEYSGGIHKLPTEYSSFSQRYRLPDGTTIPFGAESIEGNKVQKAIEFNRKRDLEFFKYGQQYEFIKVRIPSGEFLPPAVEEYDTTKTYNIGSIVLHANDFYYATSNGISGEWDASEWAFYANNSNGYNGNVFALNGVVGATISLIGNSGNLTLGLVVFSVEESVILPTEQITISQFEYLLRNIALYAGDISTIKILAQNFADEYDASESYSAGDYVIYNNRLYKAQTDTTGDWEDSDWESVTVGDELVILHNQKADKSYVDAGLAGKQDKITSGNKLLSDLVEDENQNHKFVSTTEKNTWNNKQDKLTEAANAGNGINISNSQVISVDVGNGLKITNQQVVIDDNVTATKNYVQGYHDNTKQDKLTAGDGININSSKVISVDVVNNTSSTSTTKPLSANQGKVLQDQINNLKTLGRFLAIWNASTGMPTSEPQTSPYVYHTGDYFRIGVVGNKIPTGSQYVIGGTNWTTTTETLVVGDVYYYDGTTWNRQTGGGEVTTDFDLLTNKPSYNGSEMSSETNIPEVKTAVWDAKMNKVSGAVNGNLASLNSSGEVQDSGFSIEVLEEASPTNPSGFITDAPIDNKEYARKNGQWSEVIGGGDANTPYFYKTKIKPYLYTMMYETLDFDFAKEYIDEQYDHYSNGGCTTVSKGNFVGRNLDWYYNEEATFIIRTSRSQNRCASVGVASGIKELTESFANSTENSPLYKVIPYFMQDGINEYSVYANINVVPAGDKGLTSGTTPLIEERLRLSGVMLVRYILDNFATAKEAVEYIRNYVSVYGIKTESGHTEEFHFLVRDLTNTYILEFVNNAIVILSSTDSAFGSVPNNKDIMTNFYLTNWNGQIKSVVMGNSVAEVQATGLTDHAMGLERYNLASNVYSGLSTKNDMVELMTDTLRYTQTYETETTPFWHSEYNKNYGSSSYGDITIYSSLSNYSAVETEAINRFENRSRDEESPYYGTWQTTHSSIYDVVNKKLYLYVQEESDESENNIVIDLTQISKVSVSATGSSTDVVNYITIDGIEKKLPSGGSGGTTDYRQLDNIPIVPADLNVIIPVEGTYYENIGTGESAVPFTVGDTISSIVFDTSLTREQMASLFADIEEGATLISYSINGNTESLFYGNNMIYGFPPIGTIYSHGLGWVLESIATLNQKFVSNTCTVLSVINTPFMSNGPFAALYGYKKIYLYENEKYKPIDGSGGTWGSISGTLTDQQDLAQALNGKVGTTDYATTTTFGIVRANPQYGSATIGGTFVASERTYAEYQSGDNKMLIGKATLENVFAGKGFHSVWTGTQAEFDALTEYADNTDYQII